MNFTNNRYYNISPSFIVYIMFSRYLLFYLYIIQPDLYYKGFLEIYYIKYPNTKVFLFGMIQIYSVILKYRLIITYPYKFFIRIIQYPYFLNYNIKTFGFIFSL